MAAVPDQEGEGPSFVLGVVRTAPGEKNIALSGPMYKTDARMPIGCAL